MEADSTTKRGPLTLEGIVSSVSPMFKRLFEPRANRLEREAEVREVRLKPVVIVPVEDPDCYRKMVSLENSGEMFRARLFKTVESIAKECADQGAREVFIGHPREYRYECFVEDQALQGSIDPSDYFGLLKLFANEPDLKISVDWEDVDSLQLSLTSNYLNPIIHVSWRMRWLDDSYLDAEYPQ